ncbi:MAG TPA: GntR family transcriptional regulator [Actinomycetota bacterium]|nr:GntR family transcriptional regulator [Actinomycetota bacterium]
MDKDEEILRSTGTASAVDPRPLDRDSPMPLWAQLFDELTRRMAAGAFAQRLPTDQELMATYEVGRQTVREAVRRLGESFALDRRRGRGTFVRDAQFRQPLGTAYSLFQAIESQGVEQVSVVRSRELRTDAVMAAELEVEPDEPLFYLERLRLAGGVPLAIDRLWIPAQIAAPVMDTDFSHTALYAELSEKAGIVATRGTEVIHPIVPIPSVAKLLQMPNGTAAFSIVRKTWLGERPLEHRDTIIRGDRHAFVSEWSQDAAKPARPRLTLVAEA